MSKPLEAVIDDLYSAKSAKPLMSAKELEERLSRSEDEITADFVGQADLGDPGLNNVRARFALADADTAQEKINAFRKSYPNGDLRVTPVTGEMVFRESPDKPFKKVDPGILEKFEPVGDLIDFFGPDIGAIIGELAFSKGSGSLLGFLGRMFVGGFGGEMAQQGAQTLRGVQEQSFEEVAEQSAGQGTISVIGGGVGRGVGKAVDVMRGGPAVSLAPGAEDAIRAGENMGLERNLTLGESTDIPLLKKIEGQASASLPTVQRYILERNKEITQRITSLTSPAESKKLLNTLAIEERRSKGAILGQLSRSTPKTTMTEGGESLTRGIEEYAQASQRRVGDAYEIARKIEEPKFNIANLQDELDEIAKGTRFITKKGKEATAGETLDGGVMEVIRQIRSADPSLPTVPTNVGESTAVDQLRAWRSALWDAKTPAKGEQARRSHRVAGEIYEKINNVLNDPLNTTKQFREAYLLANRMASDRLTTLEQLVIMRTARDETADQLAGRLALPRNAANLRTLRATIPSRRFAQFQDSFKYDLLEDSSNLTKRLNSFDKETIDILLSREEQAIFKKIGRQVDSLEQLGINQILKRQTKVGAAVEELVVRNDTASINLLTDMVKRSGGLDSEFGKQLRAGILNFISDRVLVKERGVTLVSAKELSRTIKDIRSSGLSKFLTPNDLALFANLDKFLPLARHAADTGTSIQAAEAAAGARGAIADILTGQPPSGAALQTVLEHLSVGVLFTKYAHVLRGMGKKSKKSMKGALAQLGAILSLAANDKGAYSSDDLERLEIITGTRNTDNGN